MISPEVMQELFAVRQVLHYLPESQATEKGWTPHEQQLFWVALTKFPQGPWIAIAEYIGTKTTRQAMTHAQKLRQKLKRWDARLHNKPSVSSLMDNVTVASENTTSSTNAPYGITAALPYDRGFAFDGQVGSSQLNFPAASNPTQTGHHADSAALPSVSYMFGRHLQSQASGTVQTTTSETMAYDDMQTMIPHDFLDELAKTLSEEDPNEEDEEITEAELRELDDGDSVDATVGKKS